MLDPDISTHDALRLLTVPEAPWSLDRRRFLQLVGMGIGAAALADFAPGAGREAFASVTPVAPTDGLLLMVGFFGGLDGLNTVVPYTDGNYYTQHGSIAIPAPLQPYLKADRIGN